MRIIKFRVWDEAFKEMLYDVHNMLSAHGSLYMNYKVGAIRAWPNNSYKIMQFTGLIDKNLKEVYEGDLITITDNVEGREPCSPTYEKTTEPMEVYWDYDFNGWKARFVSRYNRDIYEKRFLPISYESKYRLEIVGNVFENKDLVEKMLK